MIDNGCLYHHVEKDSEAQEEIKYCGELVISIKGGDRVSGGPHVVCLTFLAQNQTRDFKSKSFLYTNQLS